eukprot:2653488-Amphidinium_carterae.1
MSGSASDTFPWATQSEAPVQPRRVAAATQATMICADSCASKWHVIDCGHCKSTDPCGRTLAKRW